MPALQLIQRTVAPGKELRTPTPFPSSPLATKKLAYGVRESRGIRVSTPPHICTPIRTDVQLRLAVETRCEAHLVEYVLGLLIEHQSISLPDVAEPLSPRSYLRFDQERFI